MEKRDTISLLSKYRTPIMGVATLWIMIFHVWHPIFGEYGVLGKAEQFLQRIGFCGVDIFLMVSGLGLVSAIEKYDLLTFYKRRFSHVYPPFFLAAWGIGFFRGWSMEEILKKVFFIGFFTESIYSYLWYVPGILLFYLAFPLYFRLFQKAKNKYIFTGISIVVWYLLSVALQGILRSDFYGLTNRIPIFFVGILFGWLLKNQKINFRVWEWIICSVMFFVGIYLAYLTNYKELFLLVPTSNCCVPNFLLAISISFLLAGFFDCLERRTAKLGDMLIKIVSFLGSLSLPLYCIQEYLHTDFMKNPPAVPNVLLNVLLFTCIILAGVGLHLICELLKKSKVIG